jgi:hypothetical protein
MLQFMIVGDDSVQKIPPPKLISGPTFEKLYVLLLLILQFIILGDDDPQEIPPPPFAEFPVIVHFEITAEDESVQAIPPPLPLEVASLFMMLQLSMEGDDDEQRIPPP